MKLRDVNERGRWELTMSGAKERDKCEMQLRVPIQRFKWKVQMKAEREGEPEMGYQAMIMRGHNERCKREVQVRYAKERCKS